VNYFGKSVNLGFTVGTFAAALELNPAPAPTAEAGYKTLGDFQLNENKPGEKVSAGDIIKEYVVEPDWGMDQQSCILYSCRQDEIDHMLAKSAEDNGLVSQAFRHMYWAYYDKGGLGWDFLTKVNTPMGEAPNRSQLFFDLAVRAGASHPYWAYRFLAWSMHYAQDVTQPFHAAQMPSMQMLRKDDYLIPDPTKTAVVIAYYHLTFEKFMDANATAYSGGIPNVSASPSDSASHVTLNAAAFGAANAEQVGDAAIAAFHYGQPDGPFQDPGLTAARNCIVEAGKASISLLALFKDRLPDGSSAGASSAPASRPAPDMTPVTQRIKSVIGDGLPNP
jgi:hypothetical protein